MAVLPNRGTPHPPAPSRACPFWALAEGQKQASVDCWLADREAIHDARVLCADFAAVHPSPEPALRGRGAGGEAAVGTPAPHDHGLPTPETCTRGQVRLGDEAMMLGREWQAVIVGVLLVALAGCRQPTRNRELHTYTYEDLFASGNWTTQEFSYWRQEIDLDRSMPDYSHLGAYPIGNGRVFALTGLRVPLGVIEDVLGPTYQKTQGLLGSYVLSVMVDGKPVLLPQQSTAWVAPGGVVHTRWENREGLRVDILDTVPVEANAVLRLIVVSNRGKEDIRDLALAQTSSLPRAEQVEDDLLVTRGTTRVRFGFVGARTQITRRNVLPELPKDLPKRLLPLGAMTGDTRGSQAVSCPLGRLASGESVGKVAYIAVSDDQAGEQADIQNIRRQGFALVESGHQYWQKRAEETVQVRGVPEEIAEFLTISQYLCRVQQAKAGGFSPMHKYSYRWIRDSNGPIKFLLDAGDFGAVARDLDYHFKVCASKREIANNMELNLEPAWVPEFDWSQAPSPRAEIASFVILQNYWYFRHTGETQQLEKRWDYLRRCLDGQAIDDEGRLPFHGDETYRFPGYQLFEAREDIADYVHLRLMSADSAFEYVAAAEAMAEMAEALDKDDEASELRQAAQRIRRATERHYWQRDPGCYAPAMSDLSGELYGYPFANINLRPLWIGYGKPGEQRQVDNVLNSLAYLYRPKTGTARTTPACEYYVGMTPGYLLSNLAALDHPDAGVGARGEPPGHRGQLPGAWRIHAQRAGALRPGAPGGDQRQAGGGRGAEGDGRGLGLRAATEAGGRRGAVRVRQGRPALRGDAAADLEREGGGAGSGVG